VALSRTTGQWWTVSSFDTQPDGSIHSRAAWHSKTSPAVSPS
jgi:hypothetical protein